MSKTANSSPDQAPPPLGCFSVLFLIVGGSVVLAVLTLAVAGALAHRKYDSCDHAKLLSACRYMIAHRQEYTNSPSRYAVSWDPSVIYLKRKEGAYGAEVPEVIRELNPQGINIAEDYLVIVDPPAFPPRRRGVVAFPLGSERQWGSRCYCDGLWALEAH
jgi:hypothetical protein